MVTFAPGLMGYQRYVLVGGSMEPTIHKGSIVFDDLVRVRELRAGDVITYKPPGASKAVTHRIISAKRQKTGSPIFRTQGDANASPDMRPFKLDQPTAGALPLLGPLPRLGLHPARHPAGALPAAGAARAADRVHDARQALAPGRAAGRRAWNDLMRRPSAVVAAVTVLFAIGTAVASALPHDAELGRLAAVGPVTLSSSQPGVAILHADHLQPGDKVAGILSLTNKGDKPGVLALGVTGRRDRPGAYGGRLGNVLRLKVEDMSGRTPARESVVNQASTFALGDDDRPRDAQLPRDRDLPGRRHPADAVHRRQRAPGLRASSSRCSGT